MGILRAVLLVLHATSMINTFAHMPQIPGGYRRYDVLRIMEALRLIRDLRSTIPEEILIEGGLRPRAKPA